MAENIKSTIFKSVSDIDNFFKKYDSTGFIDWFNKNHGGKNGFAANGNRSAKRITGTDKWAQVWGHVKDIFNRDSVNLVEFLAINTIIINETGGSFKPLSEGVNKNSASSHPGVAYAFDAISGLKKSYNSLDGLNKTAYDLYHDADFKAAHGHKPYGNILSDTTDVRWKSDTFPIGFSGGSVEKEVDRDLLSNTFIGEADFQKFRGRGFIQTTGRGNYKKIIEFITSYSGSNKTILSYKSKWSQYGSNYDKIATLSSNKDWDDLFINSDSIIPCYAVYIHGKAGGYLSINVTNDSQMKSGIRRVASKIAGANANDYIDLFEQRIYQQINGLEGNTQTTPTAATQSAPQSASVAEDNSDTFNTNGDDSDDAFLKFLEETDREEIVDNGSNTNNNGDNNNQQDAGSKGTVENVMKPTIKMDPITVEVAGSTTAKADVAGNLGFFPFVWYNGIQIQYADISSFNLSSNSLLPTVSVTFFDSTGLMDEAGFPLDDTKLKVFLNPRKPGFKPIMIEFKISHFAITSNKTYVIEGVMNVNKFYLKKYEAYNNMSSYDALVEFCKRAEIGFNSNAKNTDDRMNWISIGESGFDFVNSIIDYSYVSDDGFMWGFVDFYYCFNYIDLETEFKREIDSIEGLDGSGGLHQGLKSSVNAETQKLFLTNDKSLSDSSNYFYNHSIINSSTSVSLRKGYLNTVKFYDRNAKDFMVFDIDSITSEGDKTIIMKGSPQDEDYFKEHVTSTLMGKLDEDNMHKNYHYAWVQNSQNIEDLTKIGVKLQLPNPNFNLYRFQKINVIISNHTQKFAKELINYRLSGAWLITDISFIFTNGQFKQEVTLVKRELGLSPEEVKNEGSNKSANNTPNPSNSSPSDSGADNGLGNVNFDEASSNPTTPGATQSELVFTSDGPVYEAPAATVSSVAVATVSATASNTPPPSATEFNVKYIDQSSATLTLSNDAYRLAFVEYTFVDSTGNGDGTLYSYKTPKKDNKWTFELADFYASGTLDKDATGGTIRLNFIAKKIAIDGNSFLSEGDVQKNNVISFKYSK